MTLAQAQAVVRRGIAKQRARLKKPKRQMKPATYLGPPRRVRTTKQVAYEKDELQWVPAKLYQFETARPLTAAEQQQFETNFRKRSPGKLLRLPDITKKMGQLSFS
jgi:hypothetical protein